LENQCFPAGGAQNPPGARRGVGSPPGSDWHRSANGSERAKHRRAWPGRQQAGVPGQDLALGVPPDDDDEEEEAQLGARVPPEAGGAGGGWLAAAVTVPQGRAVVALPVGTVPRAGAGRGRDWGGGRGWEPGRTEPGSGTGRAAAGTAVPRAPQRSVARAALSRSDPAWRQQRPRGGLPAGPPLGPEPSPDPKPAPARPPRDPRPAPPARTLLAASTGTRRGPSCPLRRRPPRRPRCDPAPHRPRCPLNPARVPQPPAPTSSTAPLTPPNPAKHRPRSLPAQTPPPRHRPRRPREPTATALHPASPAPRCHGRPPNTP